ncbi:MAG: hypothetical protein M1820_003765 [Bogoriella megaspora]|nr:MAG: hypothetical protein M1820_003765 [Bogoriella megaspora]
MQLFKSGMLGLAIASQALCAPVIDRQIALTTEDQKALLYPAILNRTAGVLAGFPQETLEVYPNIFNDTLQTFDRGSPFIDAAETGHIKFVWPIQDHEVAVVRDGLSALNAGLEVPTAFESIKMDIENAYVGKWNLLRGLYGDYVLMFLPL